MSDPVIRGIFDALVKRAGGVDVVASLLEARYGVGWKGTVSKMCSGKGGINIDAVIAVEDFIGDFPITNRMFERMGREARRAKCLKELAAQSALASGQAHSALIKAFSSLSPGGESLTDAERAEIIAGMRAARQVLTDIIETAEAAG